MSLIPTSLHMQPLANPERDQHSSIRRWMEHPDNRHGYISSVKTEGVEWLQFALRCRGPAEQSIEDFVNETFWLQDYFCHQTELIDRESGEVEDRVRVVLVSHTGQTCSTSSWSVLDGLDQIRSAMGNGPYAPPIPIRLIRQKTSAGRIMYRLEVYLEPTTKKAKV